MKWIKRENTYEIQKKSYRKLRGKYPWRFTLYAIKQRCVDPHHIRYHRYGGRGIKCLITESELKILWFRDKAYKMKKPSIDRDDKNGDYTFKNCKYMELGKNSKKAIKNRRNKQNGRFVC